MLQYSNINSFYFKLFNVCDYKFMIYIINDNVYYNNFLK